MDRIFLIYVGCEGKMSNQVYKEDVVYLDNAATTRVAEEVEEAMKPYLGEKFGNASTAYGYGEEAREAIWHARCRIAESLEAKPSEIYFTSGGSESDNWAIKGIAGACKEKGNHIITSRIEHHAVLNSCEYLERLGYEVTYLDVDENGTVSPEELACAIRPETTLISVMFGNNEIGTIEPIMQIGRIARERQILFHTDAVIYSRGQPGAGKTCGNGECTGDCRYGKSRGTRICRHACAYAQGEYAAQLSDGKSGA